MPTKSGIIGTVKIKMKDGTFVDLPDPISLEEITTFAEQYEYVKVVRCKDCKHAQKDTLFHTIYCNGKECTPDWFCADGERREDDDTD